MVESFLIDAAFVEKRRVNQHVSSVDGKPSGCNPRSAERTESTSLPCAPILSKVDPGSEILPPELETFWRTDDGRTACERAAAYGIDLSLLEENLRLTPGERLDRNDSALRLVQALQSAKRHARP